MSIAAEITRLQGAKADLRTAIQGKGVTVPAAAKLDDYAGYVSQIPTGSAPRLQSKTATPSGSQQVIQPDNGYDGLDKVTVAAAQLQAKSVSQNGTVTPDNGYYGLSSVAVNVPAGGGSTLTPTAGDYPVVGNGGLGGGGNNLTSTGISVTIPVAGTYRFKWCAFRRNNSTSYSWSSRLYRTRNNQTTAIGTENSTWQSTYIQENSQDIECQAGDVITVYVRGRSNSYSWGGMLTACVAQKLWTN